MATDLLKKFFLLFCRFILNLFLYINVLQDKEGVEAVSVGAILSDYQRVRVENV